MAPIAMIFGALLTALGPALFFLSEKPSPTAFIPSGFGIALIVCGIFARNEKARMHAMHFAALLGLVGFAFPAYRVIAAARTDPEKFHIESPAIYGSITMSALCFIFLGLCVKSFIDARIARNRRAEEAGPATRHRRKR